MVAASVETLVIMAYARDLGMSLGGEVYTDSSAALEISERSGVGKVRHLRTQGLWSQEVRMTGRLAYYEVLGTKKPSGHLDEACPNPAAVQAPQDHPGGGPRSLCRDRARAD